MTAPAAQSLQSKSLGLFVERDHHADLLWNQCEGPLGADGWLSLRFSQRDCDHVLVIGTPASPLGESRLPRWKKRLGRWLGRSAAQTKAQHCWNWLNLPPDRVSVLFYEPPPIVPDAVYNVAKRYASRVFGPDPRATNPLILPATWSIHEPFPRLRDEPAPSSADKPLALAAVSSGKSLISGHDQRLDFFRLLRRAGVPFELFGRSLPADVHPRGPIESKAAALRPARFAIAIENYAQGNQYITEKLWDALLCWCVPFYYGSAAADSLVPSESFVRLPDLGPGAVEIIRDTLNDPTAWSRRLPAIAEARRRALSDLRLVHWAKSTFFPTVPPRPL